MHSFYEIRFTQDTYIFTLKDMRFWRYKNYLYFHLTETNCENLAYVFLWIFFNKLTSLKDTLAWNFAELHKFQMICLIQRPNLITPNQNFYPPNFLYPLSPVTPAPISFLLTYMRWIGSVSAYHVLAPKSFVSLMNWSSSLSPSPWLPQNYII